MPRTHRDQLSDKEWTQGKLKALAEEIFLDLSGLESSQSMELLSDFGT